MELTLPYIIIMDRIYRDSEDGKLPVKDVRKILNLKFRMGRSNINSILIEMKKIGLIEYINKEKVKLKWKPNF